MADVDSVNLEALAQRVASCFAETGYSPEDLLGSAWLGVQKAREAWKTGLAPFESFAFLCGQNAVLDQIRADRRQTGSTELLGDMDLTPPKAVEYMDPQAATDLLGQMMDDAEITDGITRGLANQRWVWGSSLEELVEMFGYSTWEIRTRLALAKKALKASHGS